MSGPSAQPSPAPSPRSAERERAETHRDLILIALLGALIFLPGIASRDLWNPDEPRYAEVAREMLATGQFFVPHINGEMYTQKPPLQFWAMSAASLLTGGMNEVAARLPAVASAIGTLLLIFLLGERLFSRRAGWLAVAIFASSAKILWQGRIGQIDMQLIFWVTLAVWFWVRGETEGRPLFHRLFFVATGCATLAKGPAGFLPPLLAILAYAAWTRDRGVTRRLRPWLGLAIWAGVVLLWLLPAGLQGGTEYLEQIVFKQNVTRYADPWHHQQPFYYYLTVIPADFFPWAFLLPTAAVLGWRFWAKQGDGLSGRGFRFFICWVVVTLVFFSLSPAKRTVYILTMYPGMALALAAVLDELARGWTTAKRWVTVPFGLIAGLLTVITAAFGLFALGWMDIPKLTQELAPLPPWVPGVVAWWLLAMAAGSLAAYTFARRGRPAAATTALAAGFALTATGLVATALPAVNPLKSARPMTDTYLAQSKPEEPYAIYPRLDAPILFYTKRHATWPQNEEELQTFARQPGVKWLFIEKDDLAKLKEPLPMEEVARGADARDGYVVMRGEG